MKRILSITLALLALLLVVSITLAQSGYDLSWFKVGGGGGETTGGSYTLVGAIGQPEAGAMSGGAYTLAGGFLGAGAAQPPTVYLPLIRR